MSVLELEPKPTLGWIIEILNFFGFSYPKNSQKKDFFFFLEYSKQEHWEVMGFPQKSPLMLG